MGAWVGSNCALPVRLDDNRLPAWTVIDDGRDDDEKTMRSTNRSFRAHCRVSAAARWEANLHNSARGVRGPAAPLLADAGAEAAPAQIFVAAPCCLTPALSARQLPTPCPGRRRPHARSGRPEPLPGR